MVNNSNNKTELTLKVVVQELDELVLLRFEVGEVDEEPAAHVFLHLSHLKSAKC